MREVKFYDRDNFREWRRLKQSANDKGMSTIHDDFIDEKVGRLTFDIIPDPPERVIKSLDELNLLLYKKRISYEDLLDLLTIQALSPTRWERFKARFTP